MKIKALTFDTGGTILDWHSGICSAFQRIGERHGIALDWHTVTNDYRRLAMTPQAQAYSTVAQWLGLEPAEILMVACHNFDLNAARACGFKTAFVRRSVKWGPEGPPDPTPHPDCDIVVDDFFALADRLAH